MSALTIARQQWHNCPPSANGSPSNPPSIPPATSEWPGEMAPEAFYGLTGRFVDAVSPASEADPVALAVQFLLGVGNAIGRSAYALAEADRHYTNEFAVLVGKSAKGRKGTSLGRVKRTLASVGQGWADNRVVSGLSSGEGLIWNVRDPIEKEENVAPRGKPTRYERVVADAGEADKRLLVVESEFANVLKQTERQGNTLLAGEDEDVLVDGLSDLFLELSQKAAIEQHDSAGRTPEDL